MEAIHCRKYIGRVYKKQNIEYRSYVVKYVTPSTIQITKKMETDYKCAWTKDETYLEQEKKKKSKIKNDNKKFIISEEINEVKTLIIEKEKTHDFLEKESFPAMQIAKKLVSLEEKRS